MAEEIQKTQSVNQEGSGGSEGNNSGNEEQPMTLESLMTDLARARAENAKNKAALDKALRNNGELTKQLRERMTAQEQEDEAKRTAEEEQKKRITELEEFKREAEARERYMAMGMSTEFAKQAAKAEVSGDMDAFASIFKQYNEASLKAREAEWLKNRPEVNAGHGEEKNEMAELEKAVAKAMGLTDLA